MATGSVGEVKNEQDARRVARQIGYPIIVKASSGGGGSRMRVRVWLDRANQFWPVTERQVANLERLLTKAKNPKGKRKITPGNASSG